MAAYPVIYNVEQPAKYDRVQLAIRLVIFIILGFLGSLVSLIYLAVPVYGAIQISQKGAQRYFAEAEENITKWLRWLAGAFSFLYLLTDEFPTGEKPSPVQFDVMPEGEPTVGGVLLRIITAIPHAIILAILGWIAIILGIIAVIMILIQEKFPAGIYGFIRGYMRWNARMYVYLAGLAQAYPPFSLDTGSEGGSAVAATMPSSPPPSSSGV